MLSIGEQNALVGRVTQEQKRAREAEERCAAAIRALAESHDERDRLTAELESARRKLSEVEHWEDMEPARYQGITPNGYGLPAPFLLVHMDEHHDVAHAALVNILAAIQSDDDLSLGCELVEMSYDIDGRAWNNFQPAPTPESDDGHDAFMASCAKDCSCCPLCSENPCAGTQQGAPCDQMPCRCDDEMLEGLDHSECPPDES